MLFQETIMAKSSGEMDYLKTLKDNTLICVCLPQQKKCNHEALKYLKKKYPEIYKKHMQSINSLGDVEVHYLKAGLLLARVYTHVNVLEDINEDNDDELYMTDINALEKSLKYIHEIYSDYNVLFKDDNLDIDCTNESWERIKSLLLSIYGKTNDDAVCKIIID